MGAPKIEIFTSSNCSYCAAAKQVLVDAGLPYTERNLDENDRHLREFTRRLPRVRSLPQIFVDGQHIGGYEDLCLWQQDGRLQALANRGA